ncbi:hypothetical protein P9112_001248 [Eukaryota sp. TZLM1-RC]
MSLELDRLCQSIESAIQEECVRQILRLQTPTQSQLDELQHTNTNPLTTPLPIDSSAKSSTFTPFSSISTAVPFTPLTFSDLTNSVVGSQAVVPSSTQVPKLQLNTVKRKRRTAIPKIKIPKKLKHTHCSESESLTDRSDISDSEDRTSVSVDSFSSSRGGIFNNSNGFNNNNKTKSEASTALDLACPLQLPDLPDVDPLNIPKSSTHQSPKACEESGNDESKIDSFTSETPNGSNNSKWHTKSVRTPSRSSSITGTRSANNAPSPTVNSPTHVSLVSSNETPAPTTSRRKRATKKAVEPPKVASPSKSNADDESQVSEEETSAPITSRRKRATKKAVEPPKVASPSKSNADDESQVSEEETSAPITSRRKRATKKAVEPPKVASPSKSNADDESQVSEEETSAPITSRRKRATKKAVEPPKVASPSKSNADNESQASEEPIFKEESQSQRPRRTTRTRNKNTDFSMFFAATPPKRRRGRPAKPKTVKKEEQ